MSTRARRISGGIFFGISLLWIFLIYAYFLRSNLPLLGIFGGLFGRYSFSWANSPPLEIAQSLAVLAMTQAFGLGLLRLFGSGGPAWQRWPMAFIAGFGASGIAFVLLTMARLLHPAFAWGLWAALGGGMIALLRTPLPEWFRGAILPHAEPRERRVPLPRGALDRGFVFACIGIAALISAATLWHGVFFAETYWDSLILYLGYGRMTFLEHGFPFKAEAQVGIGLGANYPHLYSNYGAMASTLFAQWSDLHQRLAAPLAGIAACALAYGTVLALWRSHAAAAGAMLLLRSIPNAIAYTTYASDYAFAILIAAAFLAAMADFCARPTRGRLMVFALMPAIGMNLNYLMGILWVPWGVCVLACFARQFGPAFFVRAIFHRGLWIIFLAALALASPWYLRNFALTGNPVYAFFPGIFKSSVKMNVAVLRSAEVEWFRNGDGIGRIAEEIAESRLGPKTPEMEFRRDATLRDRIAATFLFYVGFDVPGQSWTGRIGHLLRFWQPEPDPPWRHAYKMMLLFPAFVPPALAVLAALALRRRWSARIATTASAGIAFAGLAAYSYFLADFYLYQTIAIVCPAAVLAGAWFALALRRRWIRVPLYAIVLAQGVVPGLAFGLMNFKFFGAPTVMGQTFNAGALDGFRNPGMAPELLYRLRFGDDVDMWNHVNEHLKGQRILTHENRHYVFDPSITMVHLDDWEIQQGYGKATGAEVAAFLRSRGLRHYLRVPNEGNHRILRELRLDLAERDGFLREAYRAGGNVLFEIAGD